MKAGTTRALLGLAALCACHMREALLEGRVYFERDLHLQWFGQMESFARALASGAWPLWDPYLGFGQPLLANANAQLFYPPTWLNLVMAPGSYYTLYLFAHLLAAGAGVFVLSRRWGVSDAGAFVAAAVWVCGGPLLSLGNVWNHLAGAALVPWIVLAVDRALYEQGLRPVLVLAAALALPILAGSPDFVLLVAPLLAGLALVGRENAAGRGPFGRLGRLLLAALLGAGLCAAQLLPSLDVVAHSSRANLPAFVRGYWSVHPVVALQTFVPLPWNSLPLSPELRAAFFESREPYLFSLYLGLPALALAALGATRAGHRHRWLLLVMAALSLLLAFGRHTPLHAAASVLLPPLRMMRYPAKAMLLVSFGIAVLAGSGFDAWQRRAQLRRLALGLLLAGLALGTIAIGLQLRPDAFDSGSATNALFRAAGLCLVLGTLAGLRERLPSWALTTAVAAAAIGIGDLAIFHRHLNPTAPSDFYRLRPSVLSGIDRSDPGRLLVFDYTMAPGLAGRYLHRDRAYMVPAEVGPRQLWRGAMGLRLYPVAPVTGGFQLFSSFGRDFLGLQPEPLARLNDFATDSMGGPEWERLLAIAGVSRLIALHENALGAATPAKRFHGPFFEDVRLYEVPGARPRCFVVDGVQGGDEPRSLAAPGFDAAHEVLLPQARPRAAAPGFEGVCRIDDLRADRVQLETRASGEAFVVLADAWDRGWSARVDGRPAPVLRANVAFRAVEVPAGRHSVDFFYRPLAVSLGLAISLVSLAATARLWVRGGRSRRDG